MVFEIKMLHQVLKHAPFMECPCKKCKRQNLQKPGMTQSLHINWREQEVHSELVIFYFYTCIPNKWKDQKLEQHVGASAALFCLTLTRIPNQTICDICWHFIWITYASIRMQLFIPAFDVLREFLYILCTHENLHRNWYMTSCDICWNFIWTT